MPDDRIDRQSRRIRDAVLWVERSRRSGSRTVAPPVRGGGIVVKQFRLKSVQQNYLTCREYDGTTEGTTDVLIAKPYLLRYSTPARSGYSYSAWNSGATTRTSTQTSPSGTESQGVVPAYVVNDIIFATRPVNGTGVTDGSGNKIPWLDMNTDARLWMKSS